MHHFKAFFELLRDANAGRALLFMSALVMGHFAIIPLLAPYLVANAGLPENKLFLVYMVGGICSALTAPLCGRLADKFGRLRVFAILIAVACVVTLWISNSGPMQVWVVLISAGLFFTSPADDLSPRRPSCRWRCRRNGAVPS